MIKIKICGLRRLSDIDIVNKYNPDYIGFIFVKGRKRYVEPSIALEMKRKLNSNIKAVGVFLDEDINVILDIASKNIIDIIQLHGHESKDYIDELKSKCNLEIINAYDNYDNIDYLLLDNPKPGYGIAWDYKIVENKKCFIAGGINKDNIKDVIKLNPYAIDISSGVEVDGYKDEKLIKEIMEEINHEG